MIIQQPLRRGFEEAVAEKVLTGVLYVVAAWIAVGERMAETLEYRIYFAVDERGGVEQAIEQSQEETRRKQLWVEKYAPHLQELEEQLKPIAAVYNPLMWEIEDLYVRFDQECEALRRVEKQTQEQGAR